MLIPPLLVALAEMAAKTFASVAASAAASRFVEVLTEENTEPPNEKIQERWQQFLDELRGELEETKRQLEETKGQLEHERRKRKKQVIAIGVVCLLLGGLVAGSGTWYVLQSSQLSEQVIALEELEQYEKARDAGLQALENYVIQNPNSPYISQAKALIRAYKGKE